MKRSNKLIATILLVSLMLSNLAACSHDEAPPIEQSGSEASSDKASDSVASSESKESGTDSDTSASAVGRDDVPTTTTRGNSSGTSNNSNDPPPIEAVPTGGRTADPNAALSPKITTTGEGDAPRHVSTGALAGVGETITLDGVTTTIEELDIPFEAPVEVTPTKPLLDSVDCTVNEIAAEGIVSESLKIITASEELASLGLDPGMYTDSFFANYCLGVADIPVLGIAASSKIISLVENGENDLELGVRFDLSSRTGMSSKRYLIELPKKYIGYTMSLKSHYSLARSAPVSSDMLKDWVYTRTEFSYTLDYPSLGTSLTNKFDIPALNFDTTAARALNEDIERTVYRECGDLIFGYENGAPGVSSSVTYNWYKYSGSTVICLMLAVSNTGKLALNSAKLYPFYYDVNTARRLTTAEYLTMCGLSREQVAADLQSGYSVTLDPTAVEAVRVHSPESYVLSYWDGGALHEYVLPVTIAENGTKYIYNMADDKYVGIAVAMPNGNSYSIGGFSSPTPPKLKFDSTGTLLTVGYDTGNGNGLRFMVVGLENGRTLYTCAPNLSEIAAWYDMPVETGVSFVVRSISGTSSHFGVVIDVTVGATGTVGGLMYYDSLTGKLTHLNADGLSIAGPYTATASGAALTLTNGAVTYTIPGAFNKAYTVEYSPDSHYAVVSNEVNSFNIDEKREGQTTLSVKYSDHAMTVVDLETGKISALPEYTIAELLAKVNLRDVGYVHRSLVFDDWTSNSTFTAVVTLMNEDASEVIPLTLTCKITGGVVSVTNIDK